MGRGAVSKLARDGGGKKPRNIHDGNSPFDQATSAVGSLPARRAPALHVHNDVQRF